MAVPPPFPGPDSGPGLPAGDRAKPALREALRGRRADHVAALGPAGALAAATHAAALILPHVPVDAVVALYLALADELDPAPLAQALAARGQRLALPALADRATMRFQAWAPGDPLERGPFRLRQPIASAPALAPDLIVTPLIGFDRHGGRIGQGAGHYDRAFQHYPGARRLGLAWSVQEVPHVPHDPWDVTLHGIATEQAFIAPQIALEGAAR